MESFKSLGWIDMDQSWKLIQQNKELDPTDNSIWESEMKRNFPTTFNFVHSTEPIKRQLEMGLETKFQFQFRFKSVAECVKMQLIQINNPTQFLEITSKRF